MFRRLPLLPLVLITSLLTSCGGGPLNPIPLDRYALPSVVLNVFPQSLSERGGEIVLIGAASSAATPFTVVVTESTDGVETREICRRGEAQFTCKVNVPPLAAGAVKAEYQYMATIRDSEGGSTASFLNVTVVRQVY